MSSFRIGLDMATRSSMFLAKRAHLAVPRIIHPHVQLFPAVVQLEPFFLMFTGTVEKKKANEEEEVSVQCSRSGGEVEDPALLH